MAEVKVAMPFTLKKQLVTDWENVTQEPRRLVKLPRELTAADVMSQYMDSKAKRSTPQQTARAQELMDGVRIYFDKVRGTGQVGYGMQSVDIASWPSVVQVHGKCTSTSSLKLLLKKTWTCDCNVLATTAGLALDPTLPARANTVRHDYP